MKQKTILFFPIEIGLAHILRSLSIAEELKRRNHKVYIVLPKRKHKHFERTTVPFLNTRQIIKKDSIEIINLLQNPTLIANLAKEEAKIVRKYKADAIVVDYRPSALIPPVIANIPTFFITGSTGLPYGFCLPKFLNIPNILFKMIIAPLVNFFIGIVKYQYFLLPTYKAVKLFDSNIQLMDIIDNIHYLVVEERSYLSNESKRNNVHYIGHTLWKGFENHSPPWINKISPDGNTVYISFGGTGFDKLKLFALAIALIKKGYRTIVSCGTIAEPEEFPKLKNLFVEKFVPGNEIAKRVDLVVCHGGYGTIIESVVAGKPFVSLPFNPDQLLHSFRMQELGLGICISNSMLQNLITILRLDWTSLQNMSSQIPVEKVVKAVESIFIHYDQYKSRIENYSKKITMNGDKKAADIIEKIMGVNS
ncbi:hypothetical protein HY041_00390 [Candidatus Roizmanbacteria bacterium]|nr:hypothetical protein [Candidatus Roizmanbacteria bacterium]